MTAGRRTLSQAAEIGLAHQRSGESPESELGCFDEVGDAIDVATQGGERVAA